MQTAPPRIQKGMVFGVFDGLHKGHRKFLSDAAARCETLFVVVTRDEIVELLKHKTPMHAYARRAAAIRAFNPNCVILPSDPTLGGWEILKAHRPDRVFLGHDQHAIADELKKLGIPFEVLEAHHPEKYKSSILNKTNNTTQD